MQGEKQNGENRGPMWEVRQRWDLDLVKTKASCQDRAEVGKRKEKAHMCGQVLVLQVRAGPGSEGSTSSSRTWAGAQSRAIQAAGQKARRGHQW